MERRILALAVILAGLALVASCTARATLRMRAASYANFLAGHGSKSETLADFWSPVYVAMMKRRESRFGKSAYDAANQSFTSFSGKSALPMVRSDEIRVETRGRFARTFIRLSSQNAVRRQEGAVRWVRVGITWYVFNGSPEEEKTYGRWPF
jgi:hypothetical protein